MAATTEASSRLKSAGEELFKTLGDRAVSVAGDRVSGLTDKLEGVASGSAPVKSLISSGKAAAEGESPVKGAMKGAASSVKDKVKDKIPGLGGKGKSSGSPKATKATNIIEQVDVGVPIKVAYNQWTEFGGFPTFMKKVENVEAADENKLKWKAQIVWSHRQWEATILEQVPEERIVWRSQGQKGHVDGAVTFHELGPNLTRIIVVLEYYPQGLFEKTGNIWRAQGRRARVELKHFQRHVMTRTILDPDKLEGWRGTIEDGEVVKSHEDALQEEQEQDEQDQQDEGQEDDGPEDEADEDSGDEPEDEADEPEDEADEPEDEADEESGDEPEDEADEYADEDEPEDEPEDEYADEDEPEDEPDDSESDADRRHAS